MFQIAVFPVFEIINVPGCQLIFLCSFAAARYAQHTDHSSISIPRHANVPGPYILHRFHMYHPSCILPLYFVEKTVRQQGSRPMFFRGWYFLHLFFFQFFDTTCWLHTITSFPLGCPCFGGWCSWIPYHWDPIHHPPINTHTPMHALHLQHTLVYVCLAYVTCASRAQIFIGARSHMLPSQYRTLVTSFGNVLFCTTWTGLTVHWAIRDRVS